MKKIAIFLPHIGSGGLTKVLLTLAEALSTNEFSVDLVILNQSIPEKLENRIPKTVNLIRLNAKRTITAVFPLIKYLKTQKPSVLLSGGPTSNCIAIAASLFNKFNTKIIVILLCVFSCSIGTDCNFWTRSDDLFTRVYLCYLRNVLIAQ